MQTASPPRRPLLRWIVTAVLVYAVTRVPVAVGVVVAQDRQGGPVSVTSFVERWDGWWYLYLAEFGYPDQLNLPDRPLFGPWGFFPTWPWTIRLLARSTGLGYDAAAGVLVVVYGVALLVALAVTTERLLGARTALVGVVVFAAFPGSIALSMPYTEGSFLLGSVLAIHLASTQRWWWACLPTFVACATRSTGVALLAALVVLAVVALRQRPRALRPLAPLFAGALGFACCLGYAGYRTGDPFIWRRAQDQWQQRLDFGVGIWRGVTTTLPERGLEWHQFGVMATMLAATAGLVALSWPHRRLLPLHWWAYGLVIAGLVFAYSNVGPRPRMILAIVPLFMLSAHTLQRSRAATAIVVGVFVVASALYAFAVHYVPWHVTA